jgi:hypothetical protein
MAGKTTGHFYSYNILFLMSDNYVIYPNFVIKSNILKLSRYNGNTIYLENKAF